MLFRSTKVAAGRNLELKDVLNIAEGRVWTGTDAVRIGLADANGGIKSAISIAADKAGIADNFQITEVLGEMDPIMEFIQNLGLQARALVIGNELNQVCKEYEAIKAETTRSGVQMYCPYRMAF